MKKDMSKIIFAPIVKVTNQEIKYKPYYKSYILSTFKHIKWDLFCLESSHECTLLNTKTKFKTTNSDFEIGDLIVDTRIAIPIIELFLELNIEIPENLKINYKKLQKVLTKKYNEINTK